MKKLLRFFIDLCLLRASPEALPSSWWLLWLLLPLQLLVNMALVGDSLGGLDKAFLASGLDVAVLLGWLWMGLRFMNHPERLQQAASALLGCGVLLGLLLLPIQWALGLELEQAPEPGMGLLAVLLIALTIWSALVNGSIFRHALGVRLGLGVALALTATVLSTLVIGALFPSFPFSATGSG